METLIVALVVIVIAAILLFGGGKLITLLKGFVGLFVEDLAKTPEGAAAVYSQAIEKAQNDYNLANNTLQKVAGQLDSAKRNIEITKTKVTETEAKCENFVKAGQFDKAELFSQERNDLMEELENQNRIAAELTPIFEEAKKINNHLETKLKQLKKDKDRVINDLKLNKQLKSMYDDMDELKNVDNVDKLLDSVKTGVKDGREKAVGARVVHENKLSTKISNANVDAKKLQSDSYIEELKKKYQK
jgi:phage shock protein A